MRSIDANDLAAAHGIDAVRKQLMAVNDAEPAGSPDPLNTEERVTLDKALERFALTMPEAKVWDGQRREILKPTAAKALMGREVYAQWLEHDERRTVRTQDVAREQAAAQQGDGGKLSRALQRYVYLYPTDSAWDEEKRDVVPLSGLRYALADVFDQWLKHSNRREVDQDKLVFDPTQRIKEGEINTFKGLPLSPVFGDDKCEGIRHLTWVLCNQNEEVWQWLIKWLAFPLQHVGAKMDTAVLMHSETQGSGKSLLFDGVIKPIYGEYGATLGQHQLESQYTDWRSRKLFALFEEVLSRDSKYSQTGTIKHMITGGTQRIEKKFVSGWEEANHMNAVFLSNEIQPFPLEQSDRRFCVIWPQMKLEEELRLKIAHELDSGGIEAFYGWLMRLDLSGFDERSKPPMNEEKERLIDFGRPSWDTFYREWERGSLDVPHTTCLAQDLFKVYERWGHTRREHVLSMTKFCGLLATRLRRRRDVHYDVGQSSKKGTFFMVDDAPSGKTQSQWLGECVREFQAAMAQQEGDAE